VFVRDVTRALDEAAVSYCIVGGLAGCAQDLADLRHLSRLLPRGRA